MKGIKTIFAALLAAATLAVVPAYAAPHIHFIGAGSSAFYQASMVAAVNDLATPLGNVHHYTSGSGGTACSGSPCSFLSDNRGVPVNENGQLWVVWAGNDGFGNPTDVWAYLQVDTVVGNRAFFSVPSASLNLSSHTGDGTHAGENKVDGRLLLGGDPGSCTGGVHCDADRINSVVASLLNTNVTAAISDVRPEDAAFEQKRVTANLNVSKLNGLGYGPALNSGAPIHSSFGTSVATPVYFTTTGKDKISGQKVPKWEAIPLGAEPIVFLTNKRTGGTGPLSGLTNVTRLQLYNLFSGFDCSTTALGIGGPQAALNAVLREPLSGTMITTEYTAFRQFTTDIPPAPLSATPGTSQENHVNPTGTAHPNFPINSNPLGGSPIDSIQTCFGATAPQGHRRRAIGTGEEVNTGVKLNDDSVGYAFFSFGNVSQLAADGLHWGYLNVDGHNPIFHDGGGDPGDPGSNALPACNVGNNGLPGGCQATDVWTLDGGGHIDSFPNVRNGSYKYWSIIRLVRKTTDADALALANATINNVNTKVADFVPFTAVGLDQGMPLIRSHFKATGAPTPNNGNVGVEKGGDVGGCILTKGDDTINEHQNTDGVDACYLFAGLK